MAKLRKSITINAPAEKIFNFITTPTNLPGVWPNLLEVKDVQPLPDGRRGKRFRFVYQMAGQRFEGRSETTECVPPERNVSRQQGGIESTVTWTFQPAAEGTEVTIEGDYKVPIPVLGKLAEPLVVQQNQQTVEKLLANLKTRLEAEAGN